jgi:Spy/CpxP family protein refolding chaperone
MLRLSKTIMVMVIMVFGMFGLFSQANAQGSCYWDSWEMGTGPGWWNYNVPASYALSTDQVTRMNDIRNQTQQQIFPLQNKLRSLRIEMRGYASDYDADVNKIKDYRNQIRDLEDQISDIRLDAHGKINKVLTKEQRTYFSQGNYGWWDMDDSWWHSGRGMMSGKGMMGNWRDGCCW